MKRAFWFHYNKPESSKVGKPQITVHYMNACHIVDNVVINCMTAGRLRKTQPRWVVAGKAKEIIFKDGVAIIN
jgi:hypothetical protein